ncbi:D123-domain-containing protein [Cladochytrium replicatum]|nr:D123-domain-containing protein [Cladochytrium replicatum]
MDAHERIASGSTAFPEINRQHIDNCAFSSWFSKFKTVTIDSVVIRPLPTEFIDYLLADGVFLPLNSNGRPQPSYQPRANDDDDYDDEGAWSDEDETDHESSLPAFPELEASVRSAIEQLGGDVFPKLNWSSPKDAVWMTGGSIKCNNVPDIFLLLKSSDFVTHDLSEPYEYCTAPNSQTRANERAEAYELVLRKWVDFAPSLEFRCFVRSRSVTAISQRDIASFYSFLLDNSHKIQQSIERFYEQHILGKFPDDNVVFDVLLSQSYRKVTLIDFNPFSPTTDSLLFSWEELLTRTNLGIRIVESQAAASMTMPYISNRLPKDAIDLSNGQSIDDFATRWREVMRNAAEL